MLEINGIVLNDVAANSTKVYNKPFAIYLPIYIFVILFAVLGNCLVCWIVLTNRRMHDSTNFLLVNLAVSDLLMALSSTFKFADLLVKDLHLGDIGCKFEVNLLNIPYASSCITVAIISFERYCAICRPLTTLTYFKERLKYIVPSIWITAVVVYFPTLYFCGHNLHKKGDQLSCDCTYRWPSLKAKNIYGIGIVLFFYVVPCMVASSLYFTIIRRLRKTIPGVGGNNAALYSSRRSVIRMLLISLIVFIIAWTPYNVLYTLKRLEINFRSIYPYVWYPSLLLAGLHCMCNPIIYCLLGNKFRQAFTSILCCSYCCRALRFRQYHDVSQDITDKEIAGRTSAGQTNQLASN
ncbi:tachykinin-like peptides receptor 86C [Xenia sp. Carnegie-2017]|uniref:tachykinin-like peptides receptor 86C n=1 Tax=Xenia sp. Carnegie-2017 TaxID=2897299 RepID=UPI001F03606D|nr:tachykinin-like peptides receptor 86C [Xenia sp. Carnegie-2017]